VADLATPTPGLVVRMDRRSAMILSALTGDGEVTVVGASGIERWPVARLRPASDTAVATATGYAVRALDAAKTAEGAASQALVEYRELFDKRKAKIQSVAHREGNSHGIGPGLEARPRTFTATVAVRVRFRYVGTSTSVGTSGPLGIDSYTASGRYIPSLVMERVMVFSMPAQTMSFNRIEECTCEADIDLPDREVTTARMNANFRWPSWESEVLAHRVAYVTDGSTNCRHHRTFTNGGRHVADVFPDAEPLAAPTVTGEFRVGDEVEVTTAHWGMQPGWRFTVSRSGDESGTVYGTSPEHPENPEWHIRHFRRVSIRAGDVVVVTERTLGLPPGTRLRVIQPPYEALRGRRLGGTRVDRDDQTVLEAHVDRVRLDETPADEADDEEDDRPF
jgi:hypothetical protein